MNLWRLLARVNGHRVLTRAAIGIISRNVQFMPYRNFSCGALDSCSSGEQSSQTRGLWSPHVIGILSVGLLLCSGKKGEVLECVSHSRDVTSKFQQIKEQNSL